MDPIIHLLGKNAVLFSLETLHEKIQIVDVIWSVNQVRLNIEPEQFRLEGPKAHAFQMAATTSTKESQQRVKLVTAWPRNEKLPLLPNCVSMKLLFWNCRGAGNDKFRNSMKDLHKDHSPDVVVLLETKVKFSAMGTFFNHFGLTDSICVEPSGRVGGLWMLWNPTTISLKPLHTSNQCIHAIVTKNNFEEWLLSAVYASPNHSLRDKLWSNLAVVSDFYNVPWLVAGDFNDHIDGSEKRSYSSSSSNSSTNQRSLEFAAHINRCNLIDLGCNGPRLTWTNNRGGTANTLVRLDRALANEEWRLKFPEASVSNIPRTSSDHCPILVNTEGTIKLNSDGSCAAHSTYGSFGGLARNEEGRWIEGFCGFIGAANVLKAELWGIKEALNLAKTRAWERVEVESDSQVAVNLINSQDEVDNHPERVLIEECRRLTVDISAKVNHILREANKCADIMARMGGTQPEQHVRILIPPDEVVEQLMADMIGVQYPRRFNFLLS